MITTEDQIKLMRISISYLIPLLLLLLLIVALQPARAAEQAPPLHGRPS